MFRKALLTTAAAIAMLALSSVAHADPITITTGNPGNQGTDNVLFNDSNLPHSGTLVTGNFSGAGLGFYVDFTSGSGNGNLQVAGGQATLEGGAGNSPFSNLEFGLQNGVTFTKAIFNIDVTAGLPPPNTVTFTVNYFDTMNNTFVSQAFTVSTNGQNFFAVEAGMGALIQSIEINSTDATFADINQFRLGGFSGTPTPEPTTMLLLGSGLVGIAARLRRRRKEAKLD